MALPYHFQRFGMSSWEERDRHATVSLSKIGSVCGTGSGFGLVSVHF